MLTVGLRATTFLSNFIAFVAFIYLFDWVQTTDKRSWSQPVRTWLLIAITQGFLIFFHIASILNIMNQTNVVGYGWTYFNFQIAVIYYSLLSITSKSLLVSLMVTVGAWFIWMPNILDGYSIPIVALIMFWAIQRYCRHFASHIGRFMLVGGGLAGLFYAVNYHGLGGIDVGWPWQILTMILLLGVMWYVNRSLTRASMREEELVRDATIDDLTQIANFRKFDADLAAAFDRYKATGELYCLYTFDIDHFKMINDLYGHLAGNEILKTVAHSVETVTRDLEYTATIYRTGGEEFSILLVNIVEDAQQARKISLAIRSDVNQLSFNFGEEYVHITVSMGQDRAIKEDKNYLDIYKRADQFLYSSKNNGRDAITVRGITLDK